MLNDAESLLTFWFTEIGPDRWFALDPALDERIHDECLDLHKQAVSGALRKWEETPGGVLCLLLLMDFLPRRMFRGTANAYATDDMAVELARMAIIKHFDDRIDKGFKLFFYLPFSHSEHLSDQRLAVFYLRERTKDPSWVASAEWRLEVIQRFGRFPHRNALLGRETTPEEAAFLANNPKTHFVPEPYNPIQEQE